ncbi:MAG: hypothetical protein LBE37_16935 [Sphingobacterium sp.]|nr:hypothetical protein [Sphingobacterium sp.]
MMRIKEQLKFKNSLEGITLQPNRKLASSIRWAAIAIALTGAILLIFSTKIGIGGRIICIAIMAVFAIQGLTDFLFRIHVRYSFDLRTQSIYRQNLLWDRRRLMKLDEAVIFRSATCGIWHYSLGEKRKQFLKNYKISPDFGTGKEQEKYIAAYEDEILSPIITLLENSSFNDLHK